MKTNPLLFVRMTVARGMPAPVTEFVFHPTRKWRFDYAWPAEKIALEVEGGVWTGGRHTRGSGFVKDMDKYNAAACLGWRVIRVVPSQLMSQNTAGLIGQCLGLPPF
jgi:very-short-patch-repair endonuclease